MWINYTIFDSEGTLPNKYIWDIRNNIWGNSI